MRISRERCRTGRPLSQWLARAARGWQGFSRAAWLGQTPCLCVTEGTVQARGLSFCVQRRRCHWGIFIFDSQKKLATCYDECTMLGQHGSVQRCPGRITYWGKEYETLQETGARSAHRRRLVVRPGICRRVGESDSGPARGLHQGGRHLGAGGEYQ